MIGLSEAVIAVLAVLLVVQEIIHARERSRLLAAVMAKDLPEYQDAMQNRETKRQPSQIRRQVQRAQAGDTGGDDR